MRIVGGDLGGRRFTPPANIPARPTTDLAREGLFNTLSNLFALHGVNALDLFGGTGSITFELISRGASKVTTVEKDQVSAAFIMKTAALFHIEDYIQVERAEVFRYLKNTEACYDFIFADPPYALPDMNVLRDALLPRLSPDGIAIIEHDGRNSFESHPHFLLVKKYGDTIFTFFSQVTKSS